MAGAVHCGWLPFPVNRAFSSVTVSVLQWLNLGVTGDTLWPAEPKIFTIPPFTEKFITPVYGLQRSWQRALFHVATASPFFVPGLS